MGVSASHDVCVVAQLTTTKPDTLALVPLTSESIASVDCAIFKSLYKSRSDMFIQHWFGSPEADADLPEGFDRKISISEVPSAAAYHEELKKKLASGCNMWSVVSFGAHPKGIADLGKLPKTAQIEEKLAREDSAASMSTCGFYCETVVQGIEDEKGVTWVDYFVTKQLCNDAKSSAVVQLVASLPSATPPKAPLSFRFREGNIPLLRMVQKIYRAHIAFHDGSEEEKEETASVSALPLREGSPKWLAFTLHTDRVVKGLHYRLKNTIRDEQGADHFSIFSDKQPNPLPTPVDSYVTEGQAIWTAEGAAIAPHSTPIETRKSNRNKLRESEKTGASMTVSSSQGNSMQAGGSISPGASYGIPGGNGVVPSASLFQMGYPAAPGMAPTFIRPGATSGTFLPSASQSGLNASAAAFTPSGSLAAGLTGSPQLPIQSSGASAPKGKSETSGSTSQASKGKSVIPQFMTAPPTTHAPLQDEKEKNEMKLKALTPIHVLEDDSWKPLWWSNASLSLIQCENQPFLEKGSIILKAPLESEFVNEKRHPTKVRVTGDEASYFVSVLMSNIEEQNKKRDKKEKREKSGKSSSSKHREAENRSAATSPSTSVTTSQRTTPQTSQQGVFAGEKKPTTAVPLTGAGSSGTAPTALPIVGGPAPVTNPAFIPGSQPTFLAPGPVQPVYGPGGMQMVPMQQVLIPAGMPAPGAAFPPPGMIPVQPGQPMMPAGAVPIGQPFLGGSSVSAPSMIPQPVIAPAVSPAGPIQPPNAK